MFTRENFTAALRRRNARRSRTTAGALMMMVDVWMPQSYSSRTSTLPRVRRVRARCQETTLTGSYAWLRTRVRCSAVMAAPFCRPLAGGFDHERTGAHGGLDIPLAWRDRQASRA